MLICFVIHCRLVLSLIRIFKLYVYYQLILLLFLRLSFSVFLSIRIALAFRFFVIADNGCPDGQMLFQENESAAELVFGE